MGSGVSAGVTPSHLLVKEMSRQTLKMKLIKLSEVCIEC